VARAAEDTTEFGGILTVNYKAPLRKEVSYQILSVGEPVSDL